MRILVNMPSQFGGRPSGVARVTFCLLEQLLEQTAHDYVLRSPWTREQLPAALRSSRLALEVTPRPGFIIFDVFRQALTMPRLCRRLGIDAILNADPFGTPTGSKRRVTIVHDLYFKTIPEQIGRRAVFTINVIFQLVLSGSHHVVSVSEATQRDLAKWYPSTAGKATTIHSASTLDVTPSEETGQPPVDGHYLLAVGNATWNKNFAVLADAFAKLSKRHPDLCLVHVGKDDDEEIRTAIQDPTVKERVVRLQGIDDVQLGALYRHARALVIPSLYEGFCLPVLEAQERDCPVVCSNLSATPEIAGKGAITFDPRNADDAARAIETILTDETVAARLRALGKVNAAQFSWKTAAKAYSALFA